MRRKRVSYNREKHSVTTKYRSVNFLVNNCRLAYNFLFDRYPVTGHLPMDYPPFYIIGAGRSGNTLLRAILTKHPDICIPPESYVLGSMAKKWDIVNFLPWQDIVKIVIGEFESRHFFSKWNISFHPIYRRLFDLEKEERSYARIIQEIYNFYLQEKFPNAVRWGDKTPRNTFFIHWVEKIFPEAQYIHIIRDGRDVTKSYMNASFWKYDMIDAAIEWREAVYNGIKFREKPADKYLEIRYEDLVTSPEEVAKQVCNFLNITFKNEMLLPQTIVNRLGDSSHDFHTNLSKPINADSIGKWETFFNEEQKKVLNRFLEKDLKYLNYL